MRKEPGEMAEGFTLIETIVAFAILLTVVAGPLSLITQGIVKFSFARNKLVALNLAQEGVELVRAVRENNVLCEINGAPGWKWDRDYRGSGNIRGTDRVIDSTQDKAVPCAALTVRNPKMDGGGDGIPLTGGCMGTPLKLDSSGRYGYAAGLPTLFSRCIDVTTPPGGAESSPEGTIPDSEMLEVVSRVTWSEHGVEKNVTIRTRLYNWN